MEKTMENEIKVSISCITYNHEKYIEQAIQSFLMQKTNFKYEILIHDDASTDSTTKIIRSYHKKYPDIIKPILQEENQLSKRLENLEYKYNFTRVKGKYIALCEGDDYWTDPYKLQKQVDYMEANPKCTLCTHSVNIVDAQNEQNLGIIRPYQSNGQINAEKFILGGGMFIGTNSILFPKKEIKEMPQWYFDAPVGDYPLQVFLASKGYAYYIDEIMSSYRANVNGSWSNRVYYSLDGRVNHYSKISDMLDGINEYTKYKYNKEIDIRKKSNLKDLILYISYIAIREGKFEKLNNSTFKRFYNELSKQEKIELDIGTRGIKL